MTDQAKQLAALLRETYLQLPIPGVTGFEAVAAVLAPLVARIERLEAGRKPSAATYSNPYFACRCGHYWKDHGDAHPHACALGCGCTAFRLDTVDGWTITAAMSAAAERAQAAAASPVAPPGKSRGAEVADDIFAACGYSTWGTIRGAIVRAIDAERDAARKDALAEAERAVRARSDGTESDGFKGGIRSAADAVARLRESP